MALGKVWTPKSIDRYSWLRLAEISKAMDCSPRKLLPWAWISQERLPMHQEVGLPLEITLGGFDARQLEELILRMIHLRSAIEVRPAQLQR